MPTGKFDINDMKRRMQGATQALKHELGGLRTGRAAASMLEPVQVDAYGTHMPLNQVATISVPEPRLLSVQVWDKSMVKAVEKAIVDSNLGLSPATEGQVLRLRIPELNEERRKELVKVAHKYAEAAKVAVRHVRRDGLDTVKKMEKNHEISEDDQERLANDVQKATDGIISEIDQLLAAKEKRNSHRLAQLFCLTRFRSRTLAGIDRCRMPQPLRPKDRIADGPSHVAIIMDGNGRWAAARGLPRAEGHRRGVEALRRVVRAAHELGIRYLTIFSFSSENWSRPATEIGDLFGLLRRFIRNDLASLHRDGVRVRVIGQRDGLEGDICALLNEAEELTRNNSKLTLVVAFNYGSRQEIAHAAQRLAREVAEGKRDAGSIDADTLGRYLDAPDIPDPDLIIRTSGEQRLSNFLMWQAAYSELVFVPVHWPDFDKAALADAIAEYARRERRFGGLAAKTGS